MTRWTPGSVLPAGTVRQTNQASIGLARVVKLAGESGAVRGPGGGDPEGARRLTRTVSAAIPGDQGQLNFSVLHVAVSGRPYIASNYWTNPTVLPTGR